MARRHPNLLLCPTAILAAVLAAHVGAAGSLRVFSIETTPAIARHDGSFAAAAAVSPTDAWAVGALTAHWNGRQWRRVTTPADTAQLADVFADGADDVWAVGNIQSGGSSQTVAQHFDDQAWSIVPTPALTGQSPNLAGVVSLAPNDAWAAGSFIVGPNIEPLFELWDGKQWTALPAQSLGGFTFLTKLSAASAADIWAVGRTVQGSQTLPFAEHWDGTAWKPMRVPHVGIGGELDGVVALSATDAWAVGSSTLALIKTISLTGNPVKTLIEHWNGSDWQVVPSPNVGPTSIFQANHLSAVVALSATDLWAVGRFSLPDGSGSQLTLALHGDGTAWTIQPVPDVGLNSVLLGAAALPPSSLWFVGGGAFPALVSGVGPLIAASSGG